ncbi:MAG: DUF2207 domain-containing protein [Sphaerochaeta sp.]|nr:DUF2207 domain-containing protein [Sphaerochaeta sp.]
MKRFALLVLLSVMILCTLGAQDYFFEHIDIAIEVGLDNSYHIEERIVANFSTPRHGIYREIPVKFGKVRTTVEDLKSSEPITRDSVSPDWVTFRLGSADRTVSGLKEYRLSYTYHIGDDRTSEWDEFYYNLLGDGWQAPIKEFVFAVTFPKAVDPSMVFLTGGAYGSTSQRGEYSISDDGRTITGAAQNLSSGEAVTLRVQMEEGYFSEVVPFVDRTIPFSIAALIGAAAMVAHALLLFTRYGREEVFVPVVRYDAPSGLSPLEVGYLADGVVDNKDLTSMLFHWADGGYLTIEEQGKKQFLFTKERDLKTAKAHERKLFEDFFAAGDGTTVTLKQLEKGTFAEAMTKVKDLVRAYFKGERRLTDPVAERKRTFALLYGAISAIVLAVASTIVEAEGELVLLAGIGLFSFGVALLFAHRITQTWLVGSKFKRFIKYVAIGILLVFLLVIALTIHAGLLERGPLYSLIMALAQVGAPFLLGVLTIVTAKRSAYAQQQLEEIAGYMEFIKAVEKPRLKLMVETDPQLFYHVLGYAIVLGLESVWAKKFKGIAIEQASWYIGSRPAANALFYSALSTRLHAGVMERAVYSQAKGGSRSPIRSSFGSSGFSGGGFGGGGGGAW